MNDIIVLWIGVILWIYTKEKNTDKVLAYIFESVLQLYIAESKEHIREMYVVSYSMPVTSHKIYEYFIDKLE